MSEEIQGWWKDLLWEAKSIPEWSKAYTVGTEYQLSGNQPEMDVCKDEMQSVRWVSNGQHRANHVAVLLYESWTRALFSQSNLVLSISLDFVRFLPTTLTVTGDEEDTFSYIEK